MHILIGLAIIATMILVVKKYISSYYEEQRNNEVDPNRSGDLNKED